MRSPHARRVGIALASVLSASVLGGCGASQDSAEPAEGFTRTEDGGIVQLSVDPEAVERLGIESETLSSDAASGDGVEAIPAAAVLYAPDGSTFVYTRGDATTFGRHPVSVQRMEGGYAWVRDGPPPGSAVVTQGAAELTGMEFGLEDE
jgi:hypothetical protein